MLSISSIEILVCKPNPCNNGGTCSIVTDTEYSCNCTGTGYTGKNCDILVVSISPIQKLLVNQRSGDISIEARTKSYIRVVIYPEHENIRLTNNNFTIQRPNSQETFRLSSQTSGLSWTSFEITSPEKFTKIPDQMNFFYDDNKSENLPGNSLKSFVKECYKVVVTPRSDSCGKSFVFRSSAWWEERAAGLVSTKGLVFVALGKAVFPVSLTKVPVSEIFYDILNYASIDIQDQKNTCDQTFLSEGQIQNAVQNDIFVKDFLQEFNSLTPSWFQVSLQNPLANINSDNLHAYLWSGQRVKSEAACKGVAIDESGMFLVYLHREKLTMQVHDKQVVMATDGIFCFVVDMCKNEPHLAIPSDNMGHLETIFSFTELQSLGWSLSVGSIGFSKTQIGENRQCLRSPSTSSNTQVAFGSTRVEYKHKKLVKSEIQGDMFVDVVDKSGKQVNITPHILHIHTYIFHAYFT